MITAIDGLGQWTTCTDCRRPAPWAENRFTVPAHVSVTRSAIRDGVGRWNDWLII